MKEKYIIGVDGGGTKTVAVLADLKGKILERFEAGSTNPNKIGFEKAISNLKNLLKKISKNYSKQIKIAYLGLAGGLERDEEKKKKIEKKLKKFFPFQIKVDGDQRIAFRAGTDEKNGVVAISGTGAIVMGWRGKKEAISGGWDWLIGDQGSAFWIGKRVLEEIGKSLDGRREKLKIKNLVFKKFKIKKEKDLYQEFYGPDFVEKVASISKIVDQLSKKGDSFSKEILKEAGKELSKMAISVIKELKLQKEKFPLVLVGGVWESRIFFESFKKEIKKFALGAKLIFPKTEPVMGAIKIALEELGIEFFRKE